MQLHSDKPDRLWQWSTIRRCLTLTYWFSTSVFESLNLRLCRVLASSCLAIGCLFVMFTDLWTLKNAEEMIHCSLLLNANVSCFTASAGNLGRVDYISEFEFDLFIRPDTCNPRFRVWFNFTVENIRETQVSMLVFLYCVVIDHKEGILSQFHAFMTHTDFYCKCAKLVQSNNNYQVQWIVTPVLQNVLLVPGLPSPFLLPWVWPSLQGHVMSKTGGVQV